jgi:hypothetical protein
MNGSNDELYRSILSRAKGQLWILLGNAIWFAVNVTGSTMAKLSLQARQAGILRESGMACQIDVQEQ